MEDSFLESERPHKREIISPHWLLNVACRTVT